MTELIESDVINVVGLTPKENIAQVEIILWSTQLMKGEN